MKDLSTIFLIVICSFLVSASAPNSERERQLRDAKEFTVRGGIPNFRKKVENGNAKIAYFGGSITEQNGWRILSFEYLRDLYWDAEIRRIDAAIGGTGSFLGVFRIDQDVLKFKPDLIFIEFAVNDRNIPSDEIRRSMEGIVRKTRRALPETDLCFVYTIVKQDLEDLFQGKMSRSASVMEEIADYYGIPSVHMGVRVAELAKQGKLLFQAKRENMKIVSGTELNVSSAIPVTSDGKIPFSPDGVHPYENTGHVLYADALKRAIPAFLQSGRPGSRPLPPPIAKDNYESTTALSWNDPAIKCHGNIAPLAPEDPIAKWFLKRMPDLQRFSPGSGFEFRFKGTTALLYCLFGPGTGSLEITVDHGPAQIERIFDAYSSYYRIAAVALANTLPDAVHTIRVKVSEKTFDKRALLNDKKSFDSHPDQYVPLNGYFGAVFLAGEVQK